MRFPITLAAALLGAFPLRAEPWEAFVVATGAPLADFAALASALEGADVVIVGEIHDNPRHQALQARLVRALAPAGVAFEFVMAEETEAINAALETGDLSAFPGAAPHAEVMSAAGPGRVFGAGVPRDGVIRAMREGAAATFDGDPARYGLAAPYAPEMQAEVEAEMRASHCDALPAEMLPGMVEAQRLRDAAFAEAVLWARAAGGLAMLVTGNGHARTDRGVPAALRVAAPDLTVFAIAQIERPDSPKHPPDSPESRADSPYDIVLLTDPAEREDPCAGFREKK